MRYKREYWKQWLEAVGVSAAKAFWEVFAFLIAANDLSTELTDVDWFHITSVAAVFAIRDIANSIARQHKIYAIEKSENSLEKASDCVREPVGRGKPFSKIDGDKDELG